MARADGRSRKTLAIYEDAFKSFDRFVGNTGIAITEIKAATIRAYLAHLMDRGLRNTTLSIHLKELKAFFNWLYHEGVVATNPVEHIKPIRTPKSFPFILSEDQVVALLKAPNRSAWHGFRDYTMLLCFVDVGLRLSELISLRLQDVSLPQRSLKLHGKGAKDRICFMGARLSKAMRKWIEWRGYKPYSEEVFITRSGDKLKPRWVQQIVSRLGVKTGIKGTRVSPHTLRHTAATLAVRNGLDVFSLQRLFGWEKVDTAMRYVHMAGTALREAHAKASPVDRLLEGR